MLFISNIHFSYLISKVQVYKIGGMILVTPYCILLSLFSVLGEEATKEECPIFVAASHSSFFDAIVIPFLKMPITLSREENKHIPFMGKLLLCQHFYNRLFSHHDDWKSRDCLKSRVIFSPFNN